MAQWPTPVPPPAAAPPPQQTKPQVAVPRVGRCPGEQAGAAAAARLAAVLRRRPGQHIREEARREEEWLRGQPLPRPKGACI
jgi:hypothetical protein